jgi:hypothetical protein
MGVMTAVAIGSAVVGGTMSFTQAAAARNARDKADRDAARFLADARGKAEKDYFSGLNVPLDAYEAELENNLINTTTAIEALQEGDARALAGGVAAVGAQASQRAEAIRIQQGKDMFALDKMKAENQDAINQQMIAMDAAAAQDSAKRGADAQQQIAASTTAGVQAIVGGVTAAVQASPLYGKTKADRLLLKQLERNGVTPEQYSANPAKYRNIVYNSDGSLIAEQGESLVPRLEMEKVDQIPANQYDPVAQSLFTAQSSPTYQDIINRKVTIPPALEFDRVTNTDPTRSNAVVQPYNPNATAGTGYLDNSFNLPKNTYEDTLRKYGLTL